MKIERAYKPNLKQVSVDEWLEPLQKRRKKISENLIKKKGNLIRFSELYVNISSWLTWEVQTPEIEKESATGLRYASKMYAAFLKLAEQPEQDLTFKYMIYPK